jgi:hypothetical protein
MSNSSSNSSKVSSVSDSEKTPKSSSHGSKNSNNSNKKDDKDVSNSFKEKIINYIKVDDLIRRKQDELKELKDKIFR